jgi:hypothetical protein
MTPQYQWSLTAARCQPQSASYLSPCSMLHANTETYNFMDAPLFPLKSDFTGSAV